MTRPAAIAAALALLMTSTAFAQTTPPLETPGETAPPPPALSDDTPPSARETLPPARPQGAGEPDRRIEPDSMSEDADRPGRDRDDDDDRRGARRGGDEDEREARRDRDDRREARRERREMMREHHGERMGGMGAMLAGEGAVFRFQSGDDNGASFVIRCAARDSTEECVEAIMPMLDRVLPGQGD